MILLGIALGYLSDYIIFVLVHIRKQGNSLYYALAVTLVSSISLFSEFKMLIANSIAVFLVSFLYFFILRRINNGILYILTMGIGLLVAVFITALLAILFAVILGVDADTIQKLL